MTRITCLEGDDVVVGGERLEVVVVGQGTTHALWHGGELYAWSEGVKYQVGDALVQVQQRNGVLRITSDKDMVRFEIHEKRMRDAGEVWPE